jgi:hypothetical protein
MGALAHGADAQAGAPKSFFSPPTISRSRGRRVWLRLAQADRRRSPRGKGEARSGDRLTEAVDAVGHDDVRDQQIDRPRALEVFECQPVVGCEKDLKTGGAQHSRGGGLARPPASSLPTLWLRQNVDARHKAGQGASWRQNSAASFQKDQPSTFPGQPCASRNGGASDPRAHTIPPIPES